MKKVENARWFKKDIGVFVVGFECGTVGMAEFFSYIFKRRMMAKVKRYDPKDKKTPFMIKGLLLFLLPLPLFFAIPLSLSASNMRGFIVNSTAFVLFILSAVIARRGFYIEKEYNRRKIAKAPKIKYKMLALIIFCIAVFITSYFGVQNSLFLSIAYVIVGFFGFYLSYGIDPVYDKVSFVSIGVTPEEVIKALEEAEKKIEAIDDARVSIYNLELNKRLKSIVKEAKKVLDMIEENPNDLYRARKFLVVYLDGAKRVTQGYAKAHKDDEKSDKELEDKFKNVLETIEKTFKEQQDKLKENSLDNLDTQIEVLKKQMKYEGV